MKKFITIALVIAMVVALVPTTFAQSTTPQTNNTFDKSDFNTLDGLKMYSVDNNGNKIASGSTPRSSMSTDFSKVNVDLSKNQTKAEEGGFADSTHYSVGLWDQSESLTGGYHFENVDFTPSNDFNTNGSKTYSMFYSPSALSPEDSDLADKVGIAKFSKGDRFWFNFDLISGYGSNGPVEYTDKDGERALIPYTIYMYSGSEKEWDPEIGVKSIALRGYWQGFTRISAEITVPENDQVYVFAVVIDDTTVQEYGIRGFQGWLTISDYEKKMKEAKVDSKIEAGKSYSANLGDGETLLAYGDDVGNVVANGKLYSIDLQAGQQLAITASGDGKTGARLFFMDENKDVITSNFLGTGAAGDPGAYDTLTWPIMPPITGTYHILVAGFMYDDAGTIDFEIVEYNEAQEGNDNLPYFPELKDQVIDIDNFGEEPVIETYEGLDIWGYAWDSSLGMGILTIVYPGTFKIVGEKTDMMLDLYDGVCVDLDNAKVGGTWCNATWAPVTINATGKSSISDSYFGTALMNYYGYYGSVYLTGDELTISGEKSNGALMEVPTHVLTKKLIANAKKVQGSFTVAFWVAGWNTPELTFAEGATFATSTGSKLQKATMYFDPQENYVYGYTISQYASLTRYYGSPDFYQIADDVVITSDGTTPGPGPGPGPGPDDPNPNDGMLGDANCDGKLNTGDATFILKHAAGIVTLEGQGLKNADVNQDGKVNTGDATMVLKIVAGIIPNPNN